MKYPIMIDLAAAYRIRSLIYIGSDDPNRSLRKAAMPTEIEPGLLAEYYPWFHGHRPSRNLLDITLKRGEGRLFVDDPTCPEIAWLFTPRGDGISLIAGNAGAKGAADFMRSTLSIGENEELFHSIAVPSMEWKDRIVLEFGHRFRVVPRISFTFDPPAWSEIASWRDRVPDGFEVRAIDLATAERIRNEVDGVFGGAWPSLEELVRKGMGACVMEGSRIASVAYSSIEPTDLCEMDVFTVEEYRGNGFIGLAASSLIEWCLERRILPHWTAEERNRASLRAARKLGFANEFRHHYLHHTPHNALRRSTTVPPASLDEYVGLFDHGKDGMRAISREGDRILYHRSVGGEGLEVLPESEDRFFLEEVDFQVRFERDSSGSITHLVHTYLGNDNRGVKSRG